MTRLVVGVDIVSVWIVSCPFPLTIKVLTVKVQTNTNSAHAGAASKLANKLSKDPDGTGFVLDRVTVVRS